MADAIVAVCRKHFERDRWMTPGCMALAEGGSGYCRAHRFEVYAQAKALNRCEALFAGKSNVIEGIFEKLKALHPEPLADVGWEDRSQGSPRAYRWRRPKHRTIANGSTRPWPRDSTKTVSGKPGAVQFG